MCGRYTVLTEDEIIEIREILKKLSLAVVRDDFEDYYNEAGEVRPTDRAPVIIKSGGEISFESVKWGFKRWNGKGVIINAKCETVRIKGTFARLVDAGRCVIPAGEFFEWDRLGGEKRKHFAKDPDGNILFMAGLYRNTPEGREFVVITKKAAGEMMKIHDRMPVILRAEQIEEWLSGKLTPEDFDALDFNVSVEPCNENPQLTF